MVKFRYSDSANADYLAALKTIREYFIEKNSTELGEKHIERFKTELKKREEIIIESPEFYSVRREYAPSRLGRLYRSFNVHWFVVFYTYDEADGVVVWYIRSSRSDYSSIIMLSEEVAGYGEHKE